MDVTAQTSLEGQFLLAMPGMADERFAQAVIAMCIHRPEGALGIDVGRPMQGLTLHMLLDQLEIDHDQAPDAPIHVGGPVEPQRGFVLHSRDWEGEDTSIVSETLAFTSTLDILRAIAQGTGPARWLVALGYAGWGIRQLDGELSGHGWFPTPGSDRILFETPASQRWSHSFAEAGIDVRLLTATPGRA